MPFNEPGSMHSECTLLGTVFSGQFVQAVMLVERLPPTILPSGQVLQVLEDV